MARTDFNTLLEAGVHFGHLKRKWNPKMAPYIFMEKNGFLMRDSREVERKKPGQPGARRKFQFSKR